ncbi:MAG: sensor histidine kinase [Candidatus Nitrosocosmicus sp.]
MAVSYLIYFYLQNNNVQEVKHSLMLQQGSRHNQSLISLAQSIQSDMKTILATTNGLSYSSNLQNGQYTDNKTEVLLSKSYRQTNSIIDRLFYLDMFGIIRQNMVPEGEDKYIGFNLSKRADWVKEAMLTKQPQFSGSYIGLDNKYRIGFANPIIHQDTNEFMGIVGVLVPVERFFEHYSGIYNVSSEYFDAFDKNGLILTTPTKHLVGKSVFGPEVQAWVKQSPVFNKIVKDVVQMGKPSAGIFKNMAGEVLASYYHVKINGSTIYTVGIITPTDAIYSSIGKIMYLPNLETAILLVIINVVLIVLLIFVYMWQKEMKKEVHERTKDLSEANTKLEIFNKELLLSEKARDEFISMVSHELLTPLMPIKVYAGMLLKPKFKGTINETQEKAIRSISRNEMILENLVHDILDIYRLELKRLKISKSFVNIKQLVEQTIDDFKSIVESEYKVIELELDFNVKPETKILCDPQRIVQVINNLLKNCIDFVPPKNGRIVVRVEQHEYEKKVTTDNGDTDGDILFTVEDNGFGIPPEKIGNLFKKFYQTDTSLTRQHGGSGLGLAICKGLVESHGGNIWIDKNYSKGASIKFTIPMREKQDLKQ